MPTHTPHTRTQSHLPFHPLCQQHQVDLAHQVDQGSLGVLALHWALSLQLGPDNGGIMVNI